MWRGKANGGEWTPCGRGCTSDSVRWRPTMSPCCVTGRLDETCDKDFVLVGRPEQWMGDFEEGPGEVEIVGVGGKRGAL